jgi:hypothetical protein
LTLEKRRETGSKWSRNITPERRKEIAAMGGTKTGERGLTGFQTKAASRAAIASPNHNTKITYACPWPGCGFIGKIPGIWKHVKPVNIIQITVVSLFR